MEGTLNRLRIYLITLERIKDYLMETTELVSVTEHRTCFKHC